MMTFAELGLPAEVQRAVDELGYAEPTPIQARAIPEVLTGRDVLAAAQTGTGKTAAFTLPIIARLRHYATHSVSPAMHPVRCLILTPTRELADQIAASVQSYTKYLPLRHTCVFGGVNMDPQKADLMRGMDIVVATPGRLLDHLEQKTIQLNRVEMLVLDEADRMLDMGFILDIRRILAQLPKTRQTLLFSATFSPEIKKLAAEFQRDPVTIEVARQNTTAATVEQAVYAVDAGQKRRLLARLINERAMSQVIVFCRTKQGADRLARELRNFDRLDAEAIHGDKAQQARLDTLAAFKDGKLRILVATDVAARGLDVSDLPFVVNFDLPNSPEDYVHRIGRTGRAGQSGVAISLMDAEEQKLLEAIEKLTRQTLTPQHHAAAWPSWVPRPAAAAEERPALAQKRRTAPASEDSRDSSNAAATDDDELLAKPRRRVILPSYLREPVEVPALLMPPRYKRS
ncbi:DEAD/DEAH box helicase [Laribacter hongkongensis]|uniref:DEAD/DEAH box helicase n=1 Tax=Laribacter hongkongensis TaxID=168471 RepID=UPI001EFE9BF9|nr:DEAD/DEAH box helicase [Laribacter hongkongensis]MCG9033093.1 DEAD/DEAH box helicase [Laribacter hongkongensis]MCG9060019.1 DEAD/DEAH box helicase [Laribacter hongkongensis]MCG9078326.1 DEAD/DEAH box helicase [Laribacter hongkongensis]MCG9087187.1 DEAD/DEAH box helicase [Laribacter hongkongensis]MCG9092888.1 DEAD/DEAH box helicase [Laribacter hongkongensis]